MNYMFQPPPVHALPVADSDCFFPVRRVYCVGRNYAAHAREMGFDPDREPPFFFANREMRNRWWRFPMDKYWPFPIQR